MEEAEEDLRALVAAARDGDPAAWERLYRRAYPRLLAYAARRLPEEDARDAVSEAMVRAVAGIARFKWTGAGVDAWLYGILRHVVIDGQRRGARSRNRVEPMNPSVAGPLDTLIADEEAAAVRAAFDRLDPSDQELLELRVVGGLSAEAVAEVVGRRAGAVRMAQSRALQRLRGQLGSEW